MVVLALDLATKCGWAMGLTEQPKPTYGTAVFENKKFDGAGMRFVKFQSWLTGMLMQFDVDIVVFEGVRSHLANATDAQHLYGGWLAMLMTVCESQGVPYTAKGVTEIKKFWTGKGNADKKAMMETAFNKGLNPSDDNQADAIALWYMLREELNFH